MAFQLLALGKCEPARRMVEETAAGCRQGNDRGMVSLEMPSGFGIGGDPFDFRLSLGFLLRDPCLP
ncbi:MAG: hypothetical protein NTNFB02_22640 [Nitrospira sp.]